MKINVIYILAIICLITACNADNKKTETNTKIHTNETYVQEKSHSFSDLKTKDTFKVNLSGTKPDNMTLVFTITQATGKVIYDLKIKATDLLGSTDPNVDLRKEVDQIKFIQNIAKEFLDEDNFLEPAVLEEQQPDSYAPDKAFYTELKSTKLNGFTYRLGKENNFYIAWSAKEQKVKIYYNCC